MVELLENDPDRRPPPPPVNERPPTLSVLEKIATLEAGVFPDPDDVTPEDYARYLCIRQLVMNRVRQRYNLTFKMVCDECGLHFQDEISAPER